MKAAAFGVALALLATPAAAVPITGTIDVLGTTDPLAGVSAGGTFTVDSSIKWVGGSRITALDFTWNGVHYTQPNTDGFDMARLEDFGIYVSVGASDGTGNRIDLFYDPSLEGDAQPAFFYYVPGSNTQFYGEGLAFLDLSNVPEPASLALLGIGLLGLVGIRRWQ